MIVFPAIFVVTQAAEKVVVGYSSKKCNCRICPCFFRISNLTAEALSWCRVRRAQLSSNQGESSSWQKSEICADLTLRNLVGGLLDYILGLCLLLAKEGADPLYGLGGDYDGGSQGSLSVDDKSVAILTAGLLILGVVDTKDMIFGLEALVEGEQHHALGVGIQLARLLLHDGELGVDLGQRLVAKIIGFFDVWGDILVGLLEVGHDGGSEGLVGGVAELQ